MEASPYPEKLSQAARLIAQAERLRLLTGAGISRASGMPTFRGHDPTWADYPRRRFATYRGFRDDPVGVWLWHNWRLAANLRATPNPAHRALAELEDLWERLGRDFQLITQNVDELHQRAGSRRILELHGNAFLARPDGTPQDFPEPVRLPPPPFPQIPMRDERGRLLRPHVVWFDEGVPESIRRRALTLMAEADLLLVVGTSGETVLARRLVERAREAGAEVIEINPAPSRLTPQSALSLTGRAEEIIPKLVSLVKLELRSSPG